MHEKKSIKKSLPEKPVDRPDRLYRLRDVLRLIPISKSSWFAGIQKGKYPAGHLLSARTRVWKESEIKAVIDSLD